MNYLKSLWAYRGFILGSVKREFQSKNRNSLLGASYLPSEIVAAFWWTQLKEAEAIASKRLDL